MKVSHEYPTVFPWTATQSTGSGARLISEPPVVARSGDTAFSNVNLRSQVRDPWPSDEAGPFRVSGTTKVKENISRTVVRMMKTDYSGTITIGKKRPQYRTGAQF